MKLTTKRNWLYFRRELFLYLIPIILIVGTIDVFVSFMRCSMHPEWSAPCNINRILAVIYGVFLILAIVFAVISSKMLRKVKKRIEEDFFAAIKTKESGLNNTGHTENNGDLSNKKHNRKDGIIKMIEESKHDEDDSFEKGVKSKDSKAKSTETKKKSVKRKIAKK